jgi:molybdopterin converting factor small subunit
VVVVIDSTRVTVNSVLDSLAATHPALERRVRDETGRTRVHVNLFVDDDNIRDLDGVETTVADGSDVSIIPAISGG